MSKIHTRMESQDNSIIQVDSRFLPDSIDIDKRTVKSVFTTERAVLRSPWFDEPYNEVLSLDPAHIRQERSNAGIPVLDGHDQSGSVLKQLGIAEKIIFTNENPEIEMRFSRKEDAQTAFQDIADGIIKTTSIGYMVYKYEDISEDNDKIKTYKAIDWEPYEISLVPVPADIDAQIRSASPTSELKEEKNINIIKNEDPILDQGEKQMENTEKVTPQTPEVNVDQVKNDAMKTERERVTEINTNVRRFNLEMDFAEKLINDGTEINEARKMIMDQVAEREEKTETVATPEVVNAPVNNVKALTNYLCHRAMPEHTELKDGQAFSGLSLIEVAREMFGKGSKRDVARRAMASSDFMSAVDAASSHTLEKAYMEAKKTFNPFVSTSFLPDYKQYGRINFSASPDMVEVKEGAEYKHGSIGDKQEKISLKKYGIIISLTEEAIINDDLDFLGNIANYGGVAARRESDVVYAVLTGVHKMADGKELFHADHGNIAVGTGAPTEEILDEVYDLFGQFKSQGGKNASYLNLEPAFLVCGTDNRAAAMKILKDVSATKSGDVNIYANDMTPIIDPRMRGQGFRVLTSPSQMKMIELAYLEGMRGPKLSTWFNEKNDTISHKIKHVFGVKAINSIGLVKVQA